MCSSFRRSLTVKKGVKLMPCFSLCANLGIRLRDLQDSYSPICPSCVPFLSVVWFVSHMCLHNYSWLR